MTEENTDRAVELASILRWIGDIRNAGTSQDGTPANPVLYHSLVFQFGAMWPSIERTLNQMKFIDPPESRPGYRGD
jgi:hypothetical protein